MAKKILIIGKYGQVSSNLTKLLTGNKDFEFLSIGQEYVDLSRPQEVLPKLNALHFKPDIIINAAAYTAVDLAEDEREKCENINDVSVREIAKFALKQKALLVHYSTDYVFDGTGTKPFLESDTVHLKPVNHYGVTKLAGENEIIRSGCEYMIFRTSWVYNDMGKNFVLTMLKLAADKDELKIINDQTGSPTYARDIAELTLKAVLKFKHSGIYHFVPAEQITWYQFTNLIIAKARALGFPVKVKNVLPIRTAEYPTKAKRPHNSRLSVAKLEMELDLQFPQIADSLTKCLLSIRDKI